MLVNALNKLTDLPKEIITFSDDMDGLRKVPENIPNKNILENNLHKPLTVIPDPFKKFNSFGEHNNEMLKKFLDNFNFKYTFKSSSNLYKSGFFNETLKLILKKYKDIMDIIIPTLGKERQKTYSPFLPICPDTGVVLEIPVLEIDDKNSKIIFDNHGKKLENTKGRDPNIAMLNHESAVNRKAWGKFNFLSWSKFDKKNNIPKTIVIIPELIKEESNSL